MISKKTGGKKVEKDSICIHDYSNGLTAYC